MYYVLSSRCDEIQIEHNGNHNYFPFQPQRFIIKNFNWMATK